MLDYSSLMREHDRLVGFGGVLDAALDGDDVAAIHAAFARLSAELVGHLAQEDSMIYPRLIAGDDAASSAAAREVIDEFADLAADWTALAADAEPERIAVDLPGFRARAKKMLVRLNGRIKRENELLYPLALRASHIRLCAESGGGPERAPREQKG